MSKWISSDSPEVNGGGILEICRLCLEKHNNLYQAKNLESFLYFVIADLELSLSENPLICFHCIQQLRDSYIFKTRCIYNQDQILKLQHLCQRPVYLQEVVQGIDFHKENEQISEVVCNSFKTLLGKEFGNSKISYKSERVDEANKTVRKDGIKYCGKEEAVDIKNGCCHSGLSNGQLIENEEFAKKQILIGHSEVLDSAELEMNYIEIEDDSEELLEPTPMIECKRDVHEVAKQQVENIEEKIQKKKKFKKKLQTKKQPSQQKANKKHKDKKQNDKKQHEKKLSKKKTEGKRSPTLPSLLSQKLKSKSDKSNQYQCFFCNRRFTQKHHYCGHLLHQHKDVPNIETYISIKIHRCQDCDYRTVSKQNMTYHIFSIHEKKKSEKKKNEKEKSEKKKREKEKSEKKILKCDICEYTTNKDGNLYMHTRRRHNVKPKENNIVKPFSCKLCKKTFSRKINLDYHYMGLHRNKKNIDLLITSKMYACNTCSFKTFGKAIYAKHVINQHMGDVS